MKTSDEDECVLCCREISIYAVGACDHPVCYECSARMRVLCETNECPICRSDMPIVICTLEKQPFTSISKRYSLIEKQLQIIFQNNEIQKAFQALLENKCKLCNKVFDTFKKLKIHARNDHALSYCELCAENLKIFPFERKTYNRQELARHKRIGDPDETSHRGHPLCEFCDERYVDSDELFRHLRREHYFCHFCDADGKHQYYNDYEYLKVHFRKEHYLCEEGDCALERFTGAFRSEIDLKAHAAVQHSKNKSKAEARQARMLELDFSYAPHVRPNANSSPRGNRYNQHRRQNTEDNGSSSRENKSRQQAEVKVESIDTQSTLEFPYLSEDGENRSLPRTKVNTMTLQSFNRNPVPQKSAEDFPALVSTTVSVSSEVSCNQNRKFNFSVHSQSNTARAPNVSIHLSQKSAQPKSSSELSSNGKSQKSLWTAKKQAATFEDEFPKLEGKKKNLAGVAAANHHHMVAISNDNVQGKPPAIEVVSATRTPGGDQFVVIKSKAKKKKHLNKLDNRTASYDRDDSDEASNSLLLSNNNFNLLDEEEAEDKYKKNLVRPGSIVPRSNYIEDSWQKKVTFGKDDFPPLASSEHPPHRRPPGFSNGPKKKDPPPGFGIQSTATIDLKPLNISLSSIARQIVLADKNKEVEVKIPHSDYDYRKPHNFMQRNELLASRIKALSLFEAFKSLSIPFRESTIDAATYYSKCLEVLGEKNVSDIFPELICLLPDINKQQELLHAHNKHHKNGGAVPKQKLQNDTIRVCGICYQVLMETDYQNHILEHETE